MNRRFGIARRLGFCYRPILLGAALLALVSSGHAQTDYSLQIGAPTFTTALPVQQGFINLANGNLHVEIPLTSAPQRGRLGFTAKLIYDSRIWQVVNNGSSQSWQPTNVPGGWGGWRFVTTANGGVTYNQVSYSCGGRTPHYWVYSNYAYNAPDGTPHFFPITLQQDAGCGVQNISSATALAQDSSGYYISVNNYSAATVYARDGTIVANATGGNFTMEEPNGNFFTSATGNLIVDTLNRTQVTTTSGGYATYYYDVLNSQGTTSRFTVTTEDVSVSTSFGQAGVTEYAGSIEVIQSIGLPDGTSYGFGYDAGGSGHYGVLIGMAGPPSGMNGYAYTTFRDANGNYNRWVNSWTSGGGTWSYSPAVIFGGRRQSVTVTKPSGDDTVYTFTLNNGAWNTETDSYTGSSTSGGTLLRTITIDYDFSQPCPTQGCTGNAYIRPIRNTTTYPVPSGNISRKTEFSYDSPQYGNVNETREWKYYTGTPPAAADRITDTTYVTSSSYVNAHMISLPTDVMVKDGSGNKISETLTTYDSTSLTAVTGITHHDDTNFGTGNTVRGNPTVVQQWVSGSTYLSSTLYYDTTGQLTKVTDPKGNSTTYSYSDNFYTDGGGAYTPPTPTNAYQTQVTLPVSGTLSYGYYFNTGQRARSTDQNGNTSTQNYQDPLSRPTNTSLANGGGGSVTYTSATQTDIYTIMTPGNNRHDQNVLDTWARPSSKALVSDPSGATKVDRSYDTTSRVLTRTNPYRSTSDPTYGQETYTYDGLDRVTVVTHADNTTVHTYYGAGVSGAGGATAQLCSSGTYGVGFPTLWVGETGMKHQSWTDGLGRAIEVDEPDPGTGSLTSGSVNATCYKYDLDDNLLEVDQGSETRTYTYDGLSRLLTSTTPEEGPSGSATGTTTYSFTASGGSLCSGNPRAVCQRTDARSVTATYAYDAEARLTSKTYSDGTPTVTYYYEQTSYNGLTITNGKGRRTGMSDGSGQTAWSYDPVGEVLTEKRTIAGVTKSITYTYNKDGTVNTITYPGSLNLSYAYDTAGRPVTVWDNYFYQYAYSAIYAPQGALSDVYLNGNHETLTYDNRLRLTGINVNSGNAVNLAYSYLGNGDMSTITNRRDTGRNEYFGYDQLNRLTSAYSQASSGADCWGQSIPSTGYDRYGNLLTITSLQCSSPTLNLTVSTKNRLTNTGFTYDNAGNLTFDGLYNYTWDAENHLKSANGVNYTYDGDLRRVEKSNGKLYWYSASGQILEETDLSGNLISDYVYFAGKRVGRRDASGTVYSYVTDPLGTTKGIISGTLCYDADFYPFGGERVFTNTCAQNYKFTGLERDAESGLDDTLFRKYSSNLGRWLTPDPLGGHIGIPQSLNRYAYVLNNPVNFVDVSGLDGCQVDPDGVIRCVSTAPPDDRFFLEVLYSYLGPSPPVNPDLAELHADIRGDRGDRVDKRQLKINNAVKALLDALKGDPCCIAFLDSGKHDAVAYLQGIVSDSTLIGHARIPAGSDGTVISAESAGGPVGQAITINDNGFFFLSAVATPKGIKSGPLTGGITPGTPRAQALILLHEVGHAMEVYGANQNDAGDTTKSGANDRAIEDHCQKTLSQFKD